MIKNTKQQFSAALQSNRAGIYFLFTKSPSLGSFIFNFINFDFSTGLYKHTFIKQGKTKVSDVSEAYGIYIDIQLFCLQIGTTIHPFTINFREKFRIVKGKFDRE